MKLLITGGQQRRRRSLTDGRGHWYKYVRGHVLEADTATGEVTTSFSYESPPELAPDDEPAILFKQGYKVGSTLYQAPLAYTSAQACQPKPLPGGQ